MNGSISHLINSEEFQCNNLYDDLKNIKSQVLIITSENDFICDPSISIEIDKAIQHSQLYILKKCGHFPFYSKKNEVISKINKFLEVGDTNLI